MPRDAHFYDEIYRGLALNREAKNCTQDGKPPKGERSGRLLNGIKRVVNWVKTRAKR